MKTNLVSLTGFTLVALLAASTGSDTKDFIWQAARKIASELQQGEDS